MDHINVFNQSSAHIYIRSSPANDSHSDADPVQDSAGVTKRDSNQGYKYYINLGNFKSFEERLEEAQELLGIDPHNYVPVTYESMEMGWLNDAMMFVFTLWFLKALFSIGKKGGISIGGPGGKAGTGIFGFGKAPITKRDKYSKEKVSITYMQHSCIMIIVYAHDQFQLNQQVLNFMIRFSSRMWLAAMRQNKKLWSSCTFYATPRSTRT